MTARLLCFNAKALGPYHVVPDATRSICQSCASSGAVWSCALCSVTIVSGMTGKTPTALHRQLPYKDARLIDTDRLILRRHTLEDFEAYRAMTADPAVYGMLGGFAPLSEDAWNRLLRYEGHWSLLEYGLLAVVERKTNTYVGNTGIADFGRSVAMGFGQVDEAAWVFTSASQGRGIAFEAAHAAHAWFDRRFGRDVVCLVAPDNTPSIRLATKLGYHSFDTVVYRGGTLNAFRRPASLTY